MSASPPQSDHLLHGSEMTQRANCDIRTAEIRPVRWITTNIAKLPQVIYRSPHPLAGLSAPM
jgi:hypothetical protein